MVRWRTVLAMLLIVGIALPLTSASTEALTVAQADQGLNGGGPQLGVIPVYIESG